jgi:AcrR family transcriptional regulator
VSSFVDEQLGTRQGHTACRACDHRDLAIELSHDHSLLIAMSMLCTPIWVLNVSAGDAGRKLCTPVGTRLGYAGRVTKLEKGPRGLRRGRGARERIVSASQQLFRDQGINCTGMDQLCAVAEVSKRTLYQHFTGKDELIAECLRRFDPDILPEVFDRTDLAPRERLLAAFDVHAPLCPFIAAAVEIPDPGHPARVHARDYKKAFAARLTDTAREAGATNPEQLGEQLALLLDGASARSRVLNTETLATAAAIAAVLVDKAIPTAAVPLGAGGNPSAGTGRVPDAATSSAEVDAEWGW